MSAIFALPGTMCTNLLWQELLPLLASKGIDLKHISIPEKQSLPEIIQALSGVLPEKPFPLLGFSLGGYLASLFASTFPHRITELTIVANTPCALSPDEMNTRKQILTWLDQFNYNGIQRKKAQAMLNQPQERWIECIQRMDAQLGGKILQQQLKATSTRDDLAPALAELNIPVKFVISNNDPLINQSWLTEFKARRPSTQIVRIDGHSHILPLEYPEHIAELF